MKRVKSQLEIIPGVGESLAHDLQLLGIESVKQLKGRDPEQMYQDLIGITGNYQDRCVLYVFRCAVYFSDNDTYDTDLLKWWNWKDK